jgi:hypothetical protein
MTTVSSSSSDWPARRARMLRIYLWVVMGGLFTQGIISLLLQLSPSLAAVTPPLIKGIALASIPHAWLHILWGALGLLALSIIRPPAPQALRATIALGLVFGVFYTLLALYGTLIGSPLNLQLVASENTFHLIVGPLTLGLTLLVLLLDRIIVSDPGAGLRRG